MTPNTHFATPAQQKQTPPSDLSGGTMGAHKKRRIENEEITANAGALLGDMKYSIMSRDLDLYQGYPHSTTGIPYAIEGTAKVINIKVGEYLAAFKDPIKTILSTNIHTEDKVMIVRKYVVGGRSMIVPEHAPARTVAVQEDVREVRLTRFGGDIEMNLNLFLRKDDAKEELDMKVDAQKRELERTLIDMGYDVLMREGTDLVDGIIRSSPLYSAHGGSKLPEIRDAADRINITQVFGAMSKHAYPVHNLLAAARYASAYTTVNEKGSVLILPHGVTDILRYTRKESMVYEIAGPALMSQTSKKINMQFEEAYTDPGSSVKIVVHRQMPNFNGGTAHPDVSPGGLTGLTSFGNFYRGAPATTGAETTLEVVDFERDTWRKITKPNTWQSNTATSDTAKLVAEAIGVDDSFYVFENKWMKPLKTNVASVGGKSDKFKTLADGQYYKTGLTIAEAKAVMKAIDDKATMGLPFGGSSSFVEADMTKWSGSQLRQPALGTHTMSEAPTMRDVNAALEMLLVRDGKAANAFLHTEGQAAFTLLQARVQDFNTKAKADVFEASAMLAWGILDVVKTSFGAFAKLNVESVDAKDLFKKATDGGDKALFVRYLASLIAQAVTMPNGNIRVLDVGNLREFENEKSERELFPLWPMFDTLADDDDGKCKAEVGWSVSVAGRRKTENARRRLMENTEASSPLVGTNIGLLALVRFCTVNEDLMMCAEGARKFEEPKPYPDMQEFYLSDKGHASAPDLQNANKRQLKPAEELVYVMLHVAAGYRGFVETEASPNAPWRTEMVAVRPNIEAMMSSAILAAPGESTGSLLVGYPFTSVSTSSQEMVKIQMRVYLGAVLKSPESVIVLRDVFFEGLKKGHKWAEGGVDGLSDKAPNKDIDIVYMPFPKEYLDRNQNLIDYADFADAGDNGPTKTIADWVTAVTLHVAGVMKNGGLSNRAIPTRIYAGSSRSRSKLAVAPFSTEETVVTNAGHMGCCDFPGCTNRLWGSFVYSDTPRP